MVDELKDPGSNEMEPVWSDGVLRHLVMLADRYGFSVGITLTVGGTIVTGNIIAAKDFFRELEKQTRAASLDSSQKEFAEVYADGFQQIADLVAVPDDAPTHIPNFIHLRNARWMIGRELVPESGSFWRGKIASIDGFTFGSLSIGRLTG